ncbi:cell envelope integrity protein TolA [Phyllobacterium sp. YR531]|uniref:cell envelope integrity protein TolA n=1 Tax=Phyllobacterium sp. YR531 TaxID=1144343 RepID=UPI00026F5285|nr:cell envelope integrity protein TolA [Phyllobacterium sp. YR531]EJN03123.1 hypothetical protein PMI41_02670 [Phyllobacterium sp. YR531]
MRLASIALTFAFSVALAVSASAQDKPTPVENDKKPLASIKKLMDDLDRLLKNSSTVKPASSGNIEDRMMNEIQACWALPAYKQGDILPETKVTVNVGKDGSLLSDPIVLKSGTDPLGKQLAESAVRAIKRCAPFKTVKDNPDSYEKLRTIVFNFKPSAL